MSETKKQREDREATEAAAKAEHDAGTHPVDTSPTGRDLGTAGTASLEAPPNQNAVTVGRGEELFAAEAAMRGGVTPAPTYPKALPREEQEANHQAAAAAQAVNITGTSDGVASILPQIGGTTNMAMTTAEVMANLDDGAVDGRGRLNGVYLDDIQARQAQERRELIEQRGTEPGAVAAAERIRSLASSPVTPGADRGKPADEQALVNPDKYTGQGDPNDPDRRAAERVDHTADNSTQRA